MKAFNKGLLNTIIIISLLPLIPVFLLSLAPAGLLLVAVIAYFSWTPFRRGVNSFFGGIGRLISSLFTGLLKAVGLIFLGFFKAIGLVFRGVRDILQLALGLFSFDLPIHGLVRTLALAEFL